MPEAFCHLRDVPGPAAAAPGGWRCSHGRTLPAHPGLGFCAGGGTAYRAARALPERVLRARAARMTAARATLLVGADGRQAELLALVPAREVEDRRACLTAVTLAEPDACRGMALELGGGAA